ncbi:MAG: N-acetylmuramoyl-L-alanine amidase [Bacteroides sp.]|nr:N-acetylmuramoyl-L-alanine amidase [Bacteroides sp.]
MKNRLNNRQLYLIVALTLGVVGIAILGVMIGHKAPQVVVDIPPITHWYDSVEWKSETVDGDFIVREFDTPNKGKGKNMVNGVVLHHTACATTEDAFKVLTSPRGGVSCHVLIDYDGTRYVLAPPDTITWHAGKSRLNGKDGANDFTVGIEFQGNTLETPLTDEQIESAIDYLLPIIEKYKIPLNNIVTHEYIRNEYKQHYPKKKNVWPKVDVTPTEYDRFMKALKNRLGETN